LAEFETRAVVGEGGFGIVYLAWDHSLHRQVAVKEYMPWSLAARTDGRRVTPRSERSSDTFMLGLRSFINEAQLLASFDHPSLLKVHRFWEDNGTAYMVMPFYQGVTLKRALAKLQEPPEEGWLLQQLTQLLDALEVMHRGNCFHRDIAPDNILLLDEGIPMLLDFGAARRVIGDGTQALTAFLKPGYAPVEQYAEMPQMKQGAWTDLYALASVLHYAITGHTPPESVARLVTDTMVPLTRAAAGRYSERFLRAIDHALGVRPHERPQSVAEMRSELGLESPRSRPRKAGEIPTAPQPLDSRPASFDELAPNLKPTKAPASVPRTALPPTALPNVTASAPRRASVPPVLIAALLALPAAVALGWWLLGSQGTPPVAKPSAGTAAAPVVDATRPLASGSAPAANTAQPADDATLRRAAGVVTETPRVETPKVEGSSVDLRKPDGPVADDAPPAIAEPPPRAQSPAVDNAPAPRATHAAAPASRPIPKLSAPDPRCAEIIARVSLGESLTAAERAVMQKECRK
jgi:hypothetical protein